MPLDAHTQAFLSKAVRMAPIHTLDPAAARLQMEQGLFSISEDARKLVAKIEDRTIPGPAGPIPIRIYTPDGSGPFPLLVFFHGGGFVLGSLNTHDPVCCELSHATECVTVSIGYRLAPEHKFPAGVDDVYAATCWIAENASVLDGDSSRIAVGGDSAGGNLAAVVAQLARDKSGPKLVFQLLIYPIIQYTETKSRRDNAEFLEQETIDWFNGHYLRTAADQNDVRASPILSSDFSGLPPALIITAEFDLLMDEGEDYANLLKDAGVAAKYTRYDGTIHGFISYYRAIPKGKTALIECAAALKTAFSNS